MNINPNKIYTNISELEGDDWTSSKKIKGSDTKYRTYKKIIEHSKWDLWVISGLGKALALTVVSFGFGLISKTVRQLWVNSFRGKETLKAKVLFETKNTFIKNNSDTSIIKNNPCVKSNISNNCPLSGNFVYDDPFDNTYKKYVKENKQQLIENGIYAKKKEWLNQGHIGRYHKYLSQKFPKLCYVSHMWMGKNVSDAITTIQKAILAYKEEPQKPTYFAIPFTVGGNHWGLLFVDCEKRTVEYYDSMKNYGKNKKILNEINLFAKSISNPESPYKVVNKIQKKLQLDGFQCGAWVSYFLENRLENPELDFNQINVDKAPKMIANFRYKMMRYSIEGYNHEFFIGSTLDGDYTKQEIYSHLKQTPKIKELYPQLNIEDLEKIWPILKQRYNPL